MPKVQGKYDTGQLFLHRIFGYRGVVLFPWLARVYDRDLPNNSATTTNAAAAAVTDNDSAAAAPVAAGTIAEAPATTGDNDTSSNKVATNNSGNSGGGGSDVKGKTNTFYQVLIDSRDCPYIVSTTKILNEESFLTNCM